ncbi:MAG: phage portal protein, partial [Vicinamibacteria bacterium]|nr:phage portal protein [Vicinamibacteria bacterium]
LQGFWRAFKPYFLTGEPKFHEFQRPNMEQLTYPGLRKFQRDIVQQTWGIPPEMFGISEGKGLTRNHYESAEYVFLKWVVAPRCERLRGRLQKEAALEFDERIVVHYATPVPADKAHELAVMGKAPWAIAESEWRSKAGLPPEFPAGELRLVPMNSYLTDDPWDLTQRPAPSGPSPVDVEEPETAEGDEKEDEAKARLSA